jgi:hypothetical protein
MSKKYTTNFLEDTNGSTGSANQVLISTPSGIDWVDGSGSGIIGGPYLPLSAGSSFPLTDTLHIDSSSSGSNQAITFERSGQETYNLTHGTSGLYFTHPNSSALLLGLTQEGDITVLNSSSSEYVRFDQSSQSVGIGTTSPGAKLDVNGAINMSYSGTNLNYFGQSNSGFGYGRMYPFNSSGLFSFDTNYTFGGGYQFKYNGSEKMRINSSGNVGIGTTSPQSKLQINDGSVNVTKAMQSGGVDHDFLQLSYAGSWANNIGGLASINFTDSLSSSNTVGRIGVTYTGSQGKFIVTDLYSGGYGASGDVFTIQADGETYIKGNVGIGTTSPESKLHVAGGDVLISNGQYYTAESNTGQNFQLATITTGNVVAIGAIDYTSAGTIFAGGDNVSITTGGVAGSSRLKILSNGNVGIGTTSPLQLLHVNGASDGNSIYTAMLQNTGTAPNTASKLLFVQGGSTIRGAVIGGLQEATAGSPTSMVFETSAAYATPTEKMRITSGGNVGIGTTSPNRSLHVIGQIALDNSASSPSAGMLISVDSASNKIYSRTANNNSTPLPFEIISGSSSSLYINSSGSVGIGTTSPGVKLDVNSSGNDSVARFTSTDARARILISDNNDTSYFGTYLGTTFLGGDDTPSGNTINVLSNGNVGIGTTSPDTLLQTTNTADGTDYISYEIGNTAVNAGNKGGFAIYELGTKKVTLEYYRDGSAITNLSTPYIFTLDTNSQERMRINSLGNVGIGTTSPSEKLEVVGNIKASGNLTAFNRLTLTDTASAAIRWILTNETNTGTGRLNLQAGQGSAGFGGGLGMYAHSHASKPGDVYAGISSGSGGSFRVNTAGADTGTDLLTINATTGATFAGTVAVQGTGNSYFQGNVGIGTTSPSTTLQLSKANTEVLANQPAWPAGILEITDTSAYDAGTGATIVFRKKRDAIGNQVTVGAIAGEGVAGNSKLSFWTGTAAYMGTAPKMVIRDNGNVGIGTTDPGSKLEISSTSEALLELNGGTTANPYMLFAQNGTRRAFVQYVNGGLLSLASEYGDIRFMTGTGGAETEKMRITSAGNVGIGTTSPVAKLSVVGSGENGGIFFNNSGAQEHRFYSSTNSQFNTIGSNTPIWHWAQYTGVGVAPNYKMTLNNTGLGIGTTSPAVQLELGDNAADEKLRLTGAASGKPLMTFYNTTTKIGQISSSSVGVTVTSLGSGNMTFENGGGPRLVIENGGNVGIGTSSPPKKLSIENGGFDMFAAGGTSADAFSVVTHNYVFSDENEDAVYSYANSEHEFSTQGFPRVTIDSVGLVGIGTTSPSSLLHVSGGELDVSGGNGYKIEDKPWAYWNSDLLTLGDWDGEGYSTRIMGSNSSEVMRVTGTNVGIGTTSPDYKLEVNGTLGVSRTDGIIFAGSAASGLGNKITSDTSNNLIFSTSLPSLPYTTTERVRILNNGNVGIGTNSPASKLEVDGGDIEVDDSASGLILRSPNGTRYRIQVDNSGNLTTTAI